MKKRFPNNFKTVLAIMLFVAALVLSAFAYKKIHSIIIKTNRADFMFNDNYARYVYQLMEENKQIRQQIRQLENTNGQKDDNQKNTQLTEPRHNPEGVSGSGQYYNKEYGFEFELPKGWSYWEPKEPKNSAILTFVSVPEGTPWGDSFHGTVSVSENIDDFKAWVEDRKRTVAESNKKYIEFLKSQKMNVNEGDFKTEYRETEFDGYPVLIETIEVVKCPYGKQNEACYLTGGVLSYRERRFFYKSKTVLNIGINTYKTEGAINGFDDLISTLKFTN